MKTLRNVKKSVIEVAQLLAADPDILKLVYIDDPDALNQEKPDISLNDLISQHYICVIPPIETGIVDSWRNTFITILLDNVYFNRNDDNTASALVIYVSTDEQHVLLVDNKMRTLEIIDRIIAILEGKKLSGAGTLSIDNFSHTMLSEFRSAYRISISFNDQNTKKVEI